MTKRKTTAIIALLWTACMLAWRDGEMQKRWPSWGMLHHSTMIGHGLGIGKHWHWQLQWHWHWHWQRAWKWARSAEQKGVSDSLWLRTVLQMELSRFFWLVFPFLFLNLCVWGFELTWRCLAPTEYSAQRESPGINRQAQLVNIVWRNLSPGLNSRLQFIATKQTTRIDVEIRQNS